MGGLSLVAAVALTSLAAYLLGRRRAGLSTAGLRAAAAATLETIGLAALFFVANLGLAGVAVLGLRALTGLFVSVYDLDDATVATVSLLQALAVRWWRGGD
ncbi:MAG TPA: hypothetical protein VHF87_16525 [Methylomirabilota bacterium]|nr:hypothetical protein [Methylomirabilota bacterium]